VRWWLWGWLVLRRTGSSLLRAAEPVQRKADAVQYLFPEQVTVARQASPVALHFRIAQVCTSTLMHQPGLPDCDVSHDSGGAGVKLDGATYPRARR